MHIRTKKVMLLIPLPVVFYKSAVLPSDFGPSFII